MFGVRPSSRVSGRLVVPDASDLRFGQPGGKAGVPVCHSGCAEAALEESSTVHDLWGDALEGQSLLGVLPVLGRWLCGRVFPRPSEFKFALGDGTSVSLRDAAAAIVVCRCNGEADLATLHPEILNGQVEFLAEHHA